MEEIFLVTPCSQRVEERIDLVVAEPRRGNGVTYAIAVSMVCHAALLILFIRNYKPMETKAESIPIARYVELIRQNPKEFTEAPGPRTDTAPLNALYSDANRKASMPSPTGEKPTNQPGDGTVLYTPSQSEPPQPASDSEGQEASDRIAPLRSTEAGIMAGPVNLRSAIREIGKVASLGNGQSLDLSGVTGGEKGTAEAGPLSFETQWYDWGEYAQSMVSKIRLHWYENMPHLIRTGVRGVITIRFTIQRDGRITDITLLQSSTTPPYDFAARKAIELASPLNPLPRDFPNPTERVTAMFYYNSSPPAR